MFTRLEFLGYALAAAAIVWLRPSIVLALEYFHYIVLGNDLTVWSDHQPLAWVAGAKKLNSRVARWLVRLNIYDFKIAYRKGKLNGNADALSRWPGLDKLDSELNNEPDPVINVVRVKTVAASLNRPSSTDVILEVEREEIDQNMDSDIHWIMTLLRENGSSRPVINKFENRIRRKFYSFYNQLLIISDKLYVDGKIGPRLILPSQAVDTVVRS